MAHNNKVRQNKLKILAIPRYDRVGSVKSCLHNDARRFKREWKHYRHPLPDSVYDVYMKYWADVRLTM